jgi:hypothetical protein
LAAVALLATGCKDGPVGASAAITVNGHEISMDRVVEISEANRAYYEMQIKAGKDTNGQYQQLLDEARGTGRDTLGMGEVASSADTLVNEEVVRQELDRLGIEVSAQAIKDARDSLRDSVGGAKELAKIDPALVDFAARFNAYQKAYAEHLAKEADKGKKPPTAAERKAQIDDLFAKLVTDQPVCLDVILTNTEADAATARDRVNAGEDFAAVVADLSVDDQTKAEDGFAGCFSYDQIPTLLGVDLAGAAKGDVAGPLPLPQQDQTAPPAWVVVRIHSTSGPTFEEARAYLEQQVPSTITPTTADQVDLGSAIDKLRKQARISIDPRLGRWDRATGSIVATAG